MCVVGFSKGGDRVLTVSGPYAPGGVIRKSESVGPREGGRGDI